MPGEPGIHFKIFICLVFCSCYTSFRVIQITSLQGNKKGPLTRWDFEDEDKYNAYMEKREAMPKAAFQFGIKMSDGRLEFHIFTCIKYLFNSGDYSCAAH